jgi:heptosyltransferase-2
MAMIQCRFFNGYKPCSKNEVCDQSCPQQDLLTQNILIVHLGAIGAVVRSTSLLKAIHEKYPKARLHWVTEKPSNELLRNHPRIDRIWTNQFSDIVQLKNFEFAAAFVIDKDLRATGVVKELKINQVFGFTADPLSGAILPANVEARELWQIGLSNHIKFNVNQKSEARLLHESLQLGVYQRPEYDLPLTADESVESLQRKRLWSQQGHQLIIGLNTGCSAVLAQKKFSVSVWVQVIQALWQSDVIALQEAEIVLLGGKEDESRNAEIASQFSTHDLIASPTQGGLKDGLISVASCDLVISGDSLGLHMAISQKIPVVAWFGPTCAHEIEFYDRAVVVKSEHACSPCWNRDCRVANKCNEEVDIAKIVQGCHHLLTQFFPNRLHTENLIQSDRKLSYL